MDELFVAKTIYGSDYLKRFLAQGVRPDGRDTKRARPLALSGGEECPVTFRVGNTMVSCGVKLEFAEPKAETPEEGYFVPNVEIPLLCDPTHKPGPPSLRSQVLSHHLLEVLNNNHVVDLKELCIVKGKISWCVYVDVMCLSDDGCLFDGIVMATMAALAKVRLPKVVVQESSSVPQVLSEESTPLCLHSHLVSSTTTTLAGHILADPTAEEERMCESRVTVVTNRDDNVCGLFKDGVPVSGELLLKCVQEGVQRCRDAHQLLRKWDATDSNQHARVTWKST